MGGYRPKINCTVMNAPVHSEHNYTSLNSVACCTFDLRYFPSTMLHLLARATLLEIFLNGNVATVSLTRQHAAVLLTRITRLTSEIVATSLD